MSDFWRVFVLLTTGGTIGGLLYWASIYISSVNLPLGSPSNKWKPSALFCFANAFMGVGGAWAALLAMSWARRAPLGRSTAELLQLIAISIVAGYAGNRILPAVAAGITEQLLESATVTALTAAQSANRSRVISEAFAYLAPGAAQTQHQTAHIISSLQAELAKSPASAEASHLLARTLAERKLDAIGAIETLKSFIAAHRSRSSNDDEDVADAYWNIARYYERLYLNGRNMDRRLRDAAIDAVCNATRIEPGYLKNLLEDPDFAALKSDEDAKRKLPALPA